MIFYEGTKVIYKEKEGFISFVDSQYVVIQWNDRPAKLIVYPNQYDTITLLKSSGK